MCILTAVVTENTEVVKSILDKFNGSILSNIATAFNTIRTFWPVLVIIAGVVSFIIFYTSRVNKSSCMKIEKLKEEKKYIQGLFVELNDSKEKLRYFLYKNKWKVRIIDEFNSLFSDNNGKLLKEIFGENEEILFSLKRNINIDELILRIDNARSFLQDLYGNKVEYPEHYQESVYMFHIYTNRYDDILSRMKTKAEYIKHNYIIIVGSAGNGKTNLLCSYAELLMKLKYPCIYINAKEVNGDVHSYFQQQLNIPSILVKPNFIQKLFIVINKFKRKPTYVLIDAVNENNQEQFLSGLPTVLNTLLKNKNIRVVVTCRSEYFETRYKKILIEEINCKSLYDNIQAQEYSQNALDRMFYIYAKEFEFYGEISDLVKSKLSQQLLLMRMFFETHRNETRTIYNLDCFAIYAKYIHLICEEKNKYVDMFLFEIVRIMKEQNNYQNISENELCEEWKKIYDKIDGTILVSQTLKYNPDSLLEKEETVVYFVFDEVRDYCIARYTLLNMCGSSGEVPMQEEIIKFLYDLKENNEVCLEGVINYIYQYYKNSDDENLCSLLLEEFIKPIDVVEKGHNYYGSDLLRGWGLKLIFHDYVKRLKCENEYLEYILYENPSKLASSILTFLVRQELGQGGHTLDIMLDILKLVPDEETLELILKNCTDPYTTNSIKHTEYIDIDKKLCEISNERVNRFREFEVLFMIFFDWSGQSTLVEYIEKDTSIKEIEEKIRREYIFVREEKNRNDN